MVLEWQSRVSEDHRFDAWIESSNWQIVVKDNCGNRENVSSI